MINSSLSFFLKKSYPYIIAILCVSIFNIFLLYTNADYRKHIEQLYSQVQFQEALEYQSYSSVVNNARITHSGIKLRDSGMSLLVFFTDRGCPSCIESEILNLQDFYNKHPQNIQAYLLSSNESFTSLYEVNFPLKVINPNETILDEELNFDNPVAILTDSNGMVQNIYVAEVGNKEKSSNFYKRMTSFFNSIH
ncbi:MAG: hypothetical protein WD491_08990 [Balneolales bacterium]